MYHVGILIFLCLSWLIPLDYEILEGKDCVFFIFIPSIPRTIPGTEEEPGKYTGKIITTLLIVSSQY